MSTSSMNTLKVEIYFYTQFVYFFTEHFKRLRL